MGKYAQVVNAPLTVNEDGSKTLQCHSKGDLRFSPFGARVTAFRHSTMIENHYQHAKVFENGRSPKDWREAKQMKSMRQVGWKIGPLKLKTRQASSEGPGQRVLHVKDFGVQFYCLLWAKYIQDNPELVEFASGFDYFEDPFAGNFPFSQAKVWELVAKNPNGLAELKNMGSELATLLVKEK